MRKYISLIISRFFSNYPNKCLGLVADNHIKFTPICAIFICDCCDLSFFHIAYNRNRGVNPLILVTGNLLPFEVTSAINLSHSFSVITLETIA